MGVRFPTADEVDLEPPNASEAAAIRRAVMTAVAGADGVTPLQASLIDELSTAMTGFATPPGASAEPLGPDELAAVLARRDQSFRIRIVQIMELLVLIMVPLPEELAEQVGRYAAALGVEHDAMLRTARRLARGSLGLALVDFQRSGYFETMAGELDHLHTSALGDAWDMRVADAQLAARWDALADCPEGSLGLLVSRFYRARGFTVPGRPDSAPPNLAQHDWIHVLAGYGSTVEGEIEVFGLISRASDDPEAFALLAMVIGLFETGYVFDAAKGFFEYDRGHLSRTPGMAARLADAMRRGALCGWHMQPRDDAGLAVDLLKVDWFTYADLPLGEVQEIFNIVPKSPGAIAAGSVSAWEPGGISPFQLRRGQEVASAAGVPYEAFGAEPAT